MGNKYSNLKIFHYQEKLDSLSSLTNKIEPPIHIRIKPTNVCNHNCWYCAYKVDHLQLGQDMIERDYIPKDKMMEIIDDCNEMGVKALTFSGGGEPFVYKYFLQTIKKIIDYNISFACLTNGSKLNGEIAELFAKYGTWLRISIDGFNNESYSNYRSTKNNEFDKIIANIEKFVAIDDRKCNLGISFIVDDKNYREIYNFSKLMKNIGVDSIKISPCVVDNSGIKNNEYHSPFYEESKYLSSLVKKELEDETFEVFDSYHLLEEKFTKDYNWCPYAQINPVIGADLNIYPCHDKAYNLENGLLGSIKDISFKNFWMTNKEKFFNINPSKHCNNHCVVNDKNKMILDYIDVEHLGFV
jgi:sulfatase maturation enzyme AslB (radical SAM superfamily)